MMRKVFPSWWGLALVAVAALDSLRESERKGDE